MTPCPSKASIQRLCRACNRWLPLSAFHLRDAGTRLRSHCKECFNARKAQRRLEGFTRHKWTPKEDAYLYEIVGDVPSGHIQRHFNAWATRKGLPSRSQPSIRNRIDLLGLSRIACGTWVSASTLYQLTGLPGSVLLGAFRRHPIKRQKVGSHHYYQRKELRRWAKANPEQLGGVSRSNLIMLLEDEELAEYIATTFPQRPKRPYRIYVPSLGKVFPSSVAAGKAMHVSRSTVHAAIRQGRTEVGGIPFQLV